MDEPVRVLHVIGSMNRGGAETMIMNLYRSIDRSLVQFDFVENTNEKASFDDEITSLGGKIYYCPHYNVKNHFEYKKWWNNFFRFNIGKYKIIHGHIGSCAAIYLRIAKNYGLFTIAHSHSSTYKMTLMSFRYSVFSYPTRYIADHFFACSHAAAVSRYGQKVGNDKNKCTLLKNSVDAQKFRFNRSVRSKMRKSLDCEGKTVIGHIGRFTAEKNHLFLIDVFAEIKHKNPSTLLLLVGDGKDRPKVEDKVRNLGLQDSVRFLGIRTDIAELMQAMDVIVFPSLYEGLPVTIIESQAAALPCLLSENVPDECKITKNIDFLSLEKPISEWADKALEMAKIERKDTYNEILSAHYDIAENAAWLQQYYINIAKDGGIK